MNKIKGIIGFIGVVILGILALSSSIDKLGNCYTVDAKVIKSINYKDRDYKGEHIEYKSNVILQYKIKGKEYIINTVEGGTYLQGDVLEINVFKNNPSKIMGSNGIVDLIVGLLFLSVALGVLLMSDRVKNVIQKKSMKKYDKDVNRDLYYDVGHEKNRELKSKKFIYGISTFLLFIFTIVVFIFTFSTFNNYNYYKEKKMDNQLVTVVEESNDGRVVTWNDEKGRVHLQYVSGCEYDIDQEFYINIEKDTEKSRKVEEEIKIKEVIEFGLLSIGLLVATVVFFVKYRQSKKAN